MVRMKIDRREPVNIYRKRREEQPGKRVRPTTIVKYAVLTLIGILLFKAGHAQALLERGYEALGGEVCALFLPVFHWMVSHIARGTIDIITFKKKERNT